MIFKLIQQITRGAAPTVGEEAVEQERRTRREAKLVDVAHEAMASDSKDLDALIRMGRPQLQHERLRTRVRGKVWDVVRETFAVPEGEMVEEITERLTEAAEVDPAYREMFAGD